MVSQIAPPFIVVWTSQHLTAILLASSKPTIQVLRLQILVRLADCGLGLRHGVLPGCQPRQIDGLKGGHFQPFRIVKIAIIRIKTVQFRRAGDVVLDDRSPRSPPVVVFPCQLIIIAFKNSAFSHLM